MAAEENQAQPSPERFAAPLGPGCSSWPVGAGGRDLRAPVAGGAAVIHLRLHTACGDSWATGFNGTEAEAVKYYLGQWFNLGHHEDRMVRVVRVEVLP